MDKSNRQVFGLVFFESVVDSVVESMFCVIFLSL